MTGPVFGQDIPEVISCPSREWQGRIGPMCSPVPEIQGKAKQGKMPAKPVIAGTKGREIPKVFHQKKDG